MSTVISFAPEVLEWLHLTSLRIDALSSAYRLWQRSLSRAERRRLGGDFREAYRRCGDTTAMWIELHRVTEARAVIDVGHKLGFLDDEYRQWLLRETGEIDDDPETLIASVVLEGGLVLVDSPRAVYWKGSKIEIDWTQRNAHWVYLEELARHGKVGKTLQTDDFGRDLDERYLAKQKSALKGLRGFPVGLVNRIVAAGRGCQRLELEPNRIRIFESETLETLREWNA